jgi:hypothetical protein
LRTGFSSTATKSAEASGAPVAEPVAARPAGTSLAKPNRTRGGGSIKLAPGSLADPALAHEPVRPAPVNEPVELSEAVFTRDPILPSTQRPATERAPRKRTPAKTAKKSVAAHGAPGGQVTSVVPEQEQAKEQPAETAPDPLNIGPVANRRRIQI